MILVDSSVWIDFFNDTASPEVEFLDSALGVHAIVIGDLIMTEVLQGFRADKDFETAKSALAEFEQVNLLGTDRAISAAAKYRELRKIGITARKTNDVIIASYCIDEKVPLLFSDKDFKPFVDKLNLIPALT